LGELENLMGTHREHDGNMMGTKKEMPKIPSHPPPSQKGKNWTPHEDPSHS
jgi:hypothetical protein